MKMQFKSFEELTNAAAAHLESLSYGPKTIFTFTSLWRSLGRFMEGLGIQTYSPEVGSQYLAARVGEIGFKKQTRWQRNQIRMIMVLSDYLETGSIRKRKNKQAPMKLSGLIGEAINEYIDYSKRVLNLSESTLQSYRLYLSRFYSYLDQNQATSFYRFDPPLLIDFAKSLHGYSEITRHLILLKAKQFLHYLYEIQGVPIDYSLMIPRDRYVQSPKLPSYFSPEEITRLVGSIDRANPNGKRDYAMVLLVAKLGLRCSDVAGLIFDNINWEHELILLIQKKTKIKVELPLLPEIGEAIIDYLKYGRPESGLSYVFLRMIPPYDGVCDNALNGIVKKYLNRAGIKYDERRHGPHALRHSLATQLMENKVTLPLISAILGHTNTESTMEYLRVDVNSLRLCALEVDIFPEAGEKSEKGDNQ